MPKKFETPTIEFDDYHEQCHTIQQDNPVSRNELKDAFVPLKINKSSGADGISFNVVKLVLNLYVNRYFIFLIYQCKKEFLQMN